jgi:hypothetical protein
MGDDSSAATIRGIAEKNKRPARRENSTFFRILFFLTLIFVWFILLPRVNK